MQLLYLVFPHLLKKISICFGHGLGELQSLAMQEDNASYILSPVVFQGGHVTYLGSYHDL